MPIAETKHKCVGDAQTDMNGLLHITLSSIGVHGVHDVEALIVIPLSSWNARRM
jgi:hypothetical protein